MTDRERLPWLDFCRALAICLVLFGHSRHLLEPYFPWLKYIKVGGFIGVELFFVLSGFLIGSILIRVSRDPNHFRWVPTFWIRRWFRTLPNYYFFLLVNFVLLYYGIRLESADAYWPYVFFLQNLAWQHPPFFGEAWSLAVEEIFYFVTPISISLFSLLFRDRRKGVLVTIALFFLSSFVAKLIYVDMFNPTFDNGVRKIVILRLDAIMIGVYFAWFTSNFTNSSVVRRVGVMLLPLFFVQPIFSLFYEKTFDLSFFARTWLFPITSLGCAGLIITGLYVVRLPSSLTWISSKIAKVSYSVYLVNLVVLALLNYAVPPGFLLNYEKWLLYIFTTFLISALTYRFIEQPFLRIRDKMIPGGSLVPNDIVAFAKL